MESVLHEENELYQQAKMRKLPPDTVRRIQSEQVVVDIVSAVKELVENALDARASRVEIILQKNGLDSIKVKDNGGGIPKSEYFGCCLRHYTSKIQDFENLQTLNTYGFRGEGLASMANLGEITIVTRCKDEPKASLLTFDKTGKLIGCVDTVGDPGTTVTLSNIFQNFPVRREHMRANLQKQSKKLKDLLITYYFIQPNVTFTLEDDPKPRFHFRNMEDVMGAITHVLGQKFADQLQPIDIPSTEGCPFHVSAVLPKPNADAQLVLKGVNERSYIYANSRPVFLPSITKVIHKHVRRHFKVNYEPNKRKIAFHQESLLLQAIEEMLLSLYPMEIDEQLAHADEFHVNTKNTEEGPEEISTQMYIEKDPPTQLYSNQQAVKPLQPAEVPPRRSIDDHFDRDSARVTPQAKKRKVDDSQSKGSPSTTSLMAPVDLQQMTKKPLVLTTTEITHTNDSATLHRSDVSNITIVGKLNNEQSGLSLLQLGPHLFLFHHFKAQEALIYNRLLSDRVLKQDLLKVPVQLSPAMLGGNQLWEIAASDSSLWTSTLSLNGFKIVRKEGPQAQVELELCALPQEVPGMGISDLVELVKLVAESPEAVPRPIRVQKFLAKEATKIRAEGPSLSFSDIKDILQRFANSPLWLEQTNKDDCCFQRLSSCMSLNQRNE